MSCQFKGDGSPCQRLSLVQSKGKKRALCQIHLVQYNRRSAATNFLKQTKDLSQEQLEAFKKKKTEESVKRTQKSINLRRNNLISTEDLEVRRIAEVLDKIFKKEAYVIVPNVIKHLTLRDIRTTGPKEPINFGGKSPSKRSMQRVSNPQNYLSNVMEAMRVVFPGCDKLVVKLLQSEAGDLAQDTHTDFRPDATTKPMKNLSAFHYSALISFQKNTRLLCHMSRTEIDIPLHSMMFFRGDFPHAGAAYRQKHCRLFISLSSASFPLTEDVVIHSLV